MSRKFQHVPAPCHHGDINYCRISEFKSSPCSLPAAVQSDIQDMLQKGPHQMRCHFLFCIIVGEWILTWKLLISVHKNTFSGTYGRSFWRPVLKFQVLVLPQFRSVQNIFFSFFLIFQDYLLFLDKRIARMSVRSLMLKNLGIVQLREIPKSPNCVWNSKM